jgi:hypothetical protein
MKRRTLALILILALLLAVPAFAAETAPDDGMATRGDVVKWLYSEYGADFPAGETDLAFTDVPSDSGEAEAVAWAAGLGIAKGYGDGRFGPEDLVTREQASAMLYRFAQAAGRGFQGAWMFLLNYPDASEVSAWADEAMHWVVMNGVLTGAEGNDSAERLAPKDGIGVNELPVWIKRMDDALATTLENEGYTLKIPVNYADRLHTELEEDMPEGMIFAVSEQASIDAAKARGLDGFGAGWLFAIEKISDAEARQMLTDDMSGRDIFAKNEAGDHFVFCTPTDVRFDRATAEEMMADSGVWAALNEWAATVKDSFINDNGLTAEHFGNSDIEIWLYRAAYAEDAGYTLSTTAYGPLEPLDSVNAASYVELALKDVVFEYLRDEEAPDGEYVVLKFEGGDRIDFFTGAGGNIVRRVTDLGDGETFEILYRAVYDDDSVLLHDIMEAWYMDLAAAHGLR